jgi:hypothetical protein
MSDIEEMRNTYCILVGIPERRRQFGTPRRTWKDDIKMDNKEIGYEGVDWIHLIQGGHHWRALVNVVMNVRVP